MHQLASRPGAWLPGVLLNLTKKGKPMKTVAIITSIVALAAAAFGALAHEVGTFCEEVNPYGPEDYPHNDIGIDI